jgi:hypothetical protein
LEELDQHRDAAFSRERANGDLCNDLGCRLHLRQELAQNLAKHTVEARPEVSEETVDRPAIRKLHVVGQRDQLIIEAKREHRGVVRRDTLLDLREEAVGRFHHGLLEPLHGA